MMRIAFLVLMVAFSINATALASTTTPKSDPISGDWDASLDWGEDTVPITLTLTLKLTGDKVTGSYESAMGTGKIAAGSWTDNKLSLSLDTPHGQMAVTGMLKDGKLVGEFAMDIMKGKWQAKRK